MCSKSTLYYYVIMDFVIMDFEHIIYSTLASVKTRKLWTHCIFFSLHVSYS